MLEHPALHKATDLWECARECARVLNSGNHKRRGLAQANAKDAERRPSACPETGTHSAEKLIPGQQQPYDHDHSPDDVADTRPRPARTPPWPPSAPAGFICTLQPDHATAENTTKRESDDHAMKLHIELVIIARWVSRHGEHMSPSGAEKAPRSE